MTNQPTGEPLGVNVSFGQIFSEVRLLHDAVARIETKLDSLSGLDARIRELERNKLEEVLPDHEERLRSLEERRMPHTVVNVAAATLGAVALIWSTLK